MCLKQPLTSMYSRIGRICRVKVSVRIKARF